MPDMRVGFIGLGAMGARMAKNIHEKGFKLNVYNRTPSRAEPFKNLGAGVYGSPSALAENSEIIIIMVTGPDALHEVVEAENGVAAGVGEGAVVVNMSTVSYGATMRASAEISCRKAAFVDAPVSGSIKPAEEGRLVILASGEKAMVDRVEPVLNAMGEQIVYLGGVGKGTNMKLAVNILLAGMVQALAESLTLGRRLGLRLADMLRVIESGGMSSPLYKAKGDAILNGDFSKKFPVSLAFKDLSLALDAAGDACVPLPVTAAAREMYNAAMARGLGDEDFAAVVKVMESLAGAKNTG
ncbi:MAG: NAD(P)-dependent oxidoreductase [Candidatus Nitrospinota bacterium M3_3B_026]